MSVPFLKNRAYNIRPLGLLFILATLALGCQPTKHYEANETLDSLKNESLTTKEESTDGRIQDSSVKEFDKFEITFEHEEKDQKLRQRLGVSWLTNDSIEFRLLTEEDLCDTQYSGNAKNKFADMDPESDEDETGESYLASEYVTEEETYILKVRISLDKDRARIKFVDKSGEDTDCIPTPNLVLIKKDAR